MKSGILFEEAAFDLAMGRPFPFAAAFANRPCEARPLRLSQTAAGSGTLFAEIMNGVGPLPFPAAIVAIVRPEATDRSFRRIASPSPSRAAWS